MTNHVKQLSREECKIIAFVAEGYTTGQISQKLRCSEPVVEKRLQQMLRKMNMGHLYQLISWAYMKGVLV